MDKLIEQIKRIIIVVPTIGLLVSSIYLSGYWSTFDIAPFDFLQVSDVLVLAIKPALIMLSVQVLAYLFFQPDLTEESSNKGKYSKVEKITYGVCLAAAAIFLILTFYYFSKMFVMSLLLLTFVSVCIWYFFKSKFILSAIQRYNLHPAFIIFTLYFFVGTFVYSKIESYKVYYNSNYKYLEREFTYTNLLNEDDSLIYVGKLNKYLFLMSKEDKSILITTFDKHPNIILHRQNKIINDEND